MGEWASYGLSDFLMYSPRTWWRLVARYNEAWWPGQALGLAAALALLVLLRRPDGARTRVALVLLAAAWAWLGWAFHWERHAEVSLAARWLAGGAGAQVVLLLVAAFFVRGEPGSAGAEPGLRRQRAAARHALGLALLMLSLLFPLVSLLAGRTWQDAEVFAFHPDPTALATLGVLLAATLPAWQRLGLALLPLLALAWSGAMRWAMAQ